MKKHTIGQTIIHSACFFFVTPIVTAFITWALLSFNSYNNGVLQDKNDKANKTNLEGVKNSLDSNHLEILKIDTLLTHHVNKIFKNR